MSSAGSFLSGFTGGFEGGRSVIDRRKRMDQDQERIEIARNRPQESVQQVAGDGAPMRPVARGEQPPQAEADRDGFIASMMPYAMEVSQRTGLDPRLIIAQSAQETGWGRSAPGNNFFGIKSHGQAGGNNLATQEVIDGQTVNINDSFRAYDSMGDSVRGYGEFLQANPRYGAMLAAGDLDGQLVALGASGYATDPNYASSVGSIARSIQMPVPASSSSGRGRSIMPAQRTGDQIISQFYKR
jgi:flagellar protein FlgJ